MICINCGKDLMGYFGPPSIFSKYSFHCIDCNAEFTEAEVAEKWGLELGPVLMDDFPEQAN